MLKATRTSSGASSTACWRRQRASGVIELWKAQPPTHRRRSAAPRPPNLPGAVTTCAVAGGEGGSGFDCGARAGLPGAPGDNAAGGAGTKSILRTGIATHQIVEAAKELDVDLIVIATHGFTGWKHFAICSTAERVARAAPCPVLVVREKEHDFI